MPALDRNVIAPLIAVVSPSCSCASMNAMVSSTYSPVSTHACVAHVPGVECHLSTRSFSPSSVYRVLFLCSQNRLRSPTAERLFSTWPGVEVESAGLNHDATVPVDAELLAWADLVVVMERAHRNRLSRRFRSSLGGKRIVCLDIPDDFEYMEPALVALLERKVPSLLPGGHRQQAGVD
jgi:predicted protein tyrosine phosphatase